MFPAELKIIDPTTIAPEGLDLPELRAMRIGVDVLRLDKIHPVISGNKWFKLREHLQIACAGNYRHILTFGGAWSNHIVATAYAARSSGLRATGFIRGEEPGTWSDTLVAARSFGMDLKFISRREYAAKDDPAFLRQLAGEAPGGYVIPEGGGGAPGIKGSADIGQWFDRTRYSHILCAMGTGTMFRGLAMASLPGQILIGVPVLKGMKAPDTSLPACCRIEAGYHFGGYARRPENLFSFMRQFYRDTGIPTDFVYTGKLCFAALDLARKGYFPAGSQLLVIHSGGLQGNRSLPPGALNF
ncbi:MAG: pyridoxal-phosphate dependent enzyme [Bacteroidota bacterium]|nr:pyridoxal-phosphate dependent enzyme [Bacteroidota bacterium]MDP4217701.1 pyridoxal-phosphate dependent enzyme [Bacteroidota bacterium]MDP4246111.1 pyridoxal-phosphate dependent enzyme [Bacteroidota bacterium]MDP4254125.1 pyridoxal-phosphate dependent enzyme [Bacteroidota bacterium]MDP4257147.1 pyridoxal-phosphate dependent enzyme [Bacteroidota bacterium]